MGNYPPIERLKVTDFQSLASADIELGGLTVIVGPSNSGKSALLRALRAAVRNVNSPSAVRAGKTAFTASVEWSGTTVAIERGKSQSTYKVLLPDGSEDVFTKSGRDVPEEIQGLLGLRKPEGPDLTFSSQIDPPFLLAETGTTAAKMLGDLTNVSRLHAASREANRRRQEASRLVEIRKSDAVAIATRLRDDFSNLRDQAETLKEARVQFDSVQEKRLLAEKTHTVLQDLELLDATVGDLRTRLGELPEPADIESLSTQVGERMGQRAVITDLVTSLAKCSELRAHFLTEIQNLENEEAQLEAAHREALTEMGTCPTCGQEVAA